jgi:hypothetical protein
MNLKLEFCRYLCAVEKFEVNGISADKDDFGEKYDRDPHAAEPYGCGDMRFTRIDSTPEVLAKYGITETEYEEVCGELENGLSFGHCGWCT